MKAASRSMVMIDTSAWIEFLRPRPATSEAMRDKVQCYLESGQARICGVVITELLQGAKGRKEIDQLEQIFNLTPSLETLERDWQTAGLKLQQLKLHGLTAPVTDAVIAAVALRNKLDVLTLDKHFDHLMSP